MAGDQILLPDEIPRQNISQEEEIVKNTNKHFESESTNVAEGFVQDNIILFIYESASDNFTYFHEEAAINNQLPGESSTPLTAEQYLSHNLCTNVLQNLVAPAHILDHQYAAANGNLNLQNSNNKNTAINNENNIRHKESIANYFSSNNLMSAQKEIIELKKQLHLKSIEQQNLQKQLKRLQGNTKAVINKKVHDVLKSVFSPSQIDKLMNPHKNKIKWSVSDIISAISLHNVSLEAYRHLRDNNYPLPGLSTIQKWTARFNVNEGLLSDVLTFMKHKAKSLDDFQKIVVLNFGEATVSNKNCQFCIIRSLFYKWMQPIYYSFNKSLSGDIIKFIILKLYDAGYIVVALTCNFQSHNIRVWKDLNLGINCSEQCYFIHPINESLKIFVFPDEAHLLVLLRNHFLNYGFILNGKSINKLCIEEIINIDKQLEGKEFHKITSEFLEESESMDQNVLLVKKLFSKLTAREIFSYGQEGFILYEDWKETSEFFELVSEWIDLYSSSVNEGCKKGKEPYGLCLDNQNNILFNIEQLILNIDIQNRESSFLQDQIVLRCVSLQQLLIYLQETFSTEDFCIKYIFTNRFNSELLNSYSVYFSNKDVTNNKSAILKFQNKMRNCILGKYSCDSAFDDVLKISEPCLIDFNEKRGASSSDAKKPKNYNLKT